MAGVVGFEPTVHEIKLVDIVIRKITKTVVKSVVNNFQFVGVFLRNEDGARY